MNIGAGYAPGYLENKKEIFVLLLLTEVKLRV